MRKYFAGLITVIMLFPLMGSANIRAPYRKSYTSGGEIRSSIPLTVMSCKLLFTFGRYYTGDLNDVLSQGESMCTVEASYTVMASKPSQAEFTFITPSTKSFRVTINGQRAATVFKSNNPEETEAGFNKIVNKFHTYSVTFGANIKNGINAIKVTYLQPISIAEKAYGYFTSSKWHSYVNYFYWPLKEWKKESTFKSEVIVTVPYDWGLIDKITGPDINITLTGFDKSRKNSRKFKGTDQTEFGPQVFRAFLLKDNLPDILEVGVEEK